jgi:hypothetical protein
VLRQTQDNEEPAAGQRDDLRHWYGTKTFRVPQWSPPLGGGTTGPIGVQRGDQLPAAMEPAEHRFAGLPS